MKIFFKNISYLFGIFFIFETSNSLASDKVLNIVTSINPIYQIAKFISDDHIFLLIDPNISEHDYTPKPSDIRNINNADIIFYISDELEYYLPKILKTTNNKARIVELINYPNLKLLKIKNDKSSNIYKTDPHIWLSPDNAVIIAKIIAESLSDLNPDHSVQYKNNLEKFINEVNINNQKTINNFSKIRKSNYLIYHNCFQYFEDYYHLDSSKAIPYLQRPQLTIGDIKSINDVIKRNNIKCIIAQPQEESSLALEIAHANKIKFVIANLIGQKKYDEKNGYVKLMNDLVLNFSNCIIANN